jgi:hypothetical protein
MTNEIVTTQNSELAVVDRQPLDQNAALVFLMSQNSTTGRRTQRQSLEVIAPTREENNCTMPA